MSNIMKALGWASVILLAAFVMQSRGVSDGASAGIIIAIASAAWGTMISQAPCAIRCGKARN